MSQLIMGRINRSQSVSEHVFPVFDHQGCSALDLSLCNRETAMHHLSLFLLVA